MQESFSHLDARGRLSMVDVGGKAATERRAIAEAVVALAPETMQLLRTQALPKGDVLTCAKVAGILAAKRTGELIPLCHPLGLSFVDIRFAITDGCVRITAETRTTGPIYDMCKAVLRDIVIKNVGLLHKSGGKRGVFNVPGFQPPE